MAGKKNFSGSLVKGITRDGVMRASLDDRFSRAEQLITAKPNGLLSASPIHDVSSVDQNNTPAPAVADDTIAGRAGHVASPIPQSTADVGPTHSGGIADRLGELSAKGVKQRFVSLPIEMLQSNPLNSRSYYNPEAIEARAVSIQKEGQLVPVLVTPDSRQPGKYLLIDGHYRRLAMQSIGRKQMDCCILEDLQPVDFYRLSKALNHEREGETVLDVALGLQKLKDNQIANTDEDLVSIAGENATKISKLLSLLELPTAVKETIQEHPQHFGINTAYELTLYQKASDTRMTEQLARRIVDESLTFRKVESIRKNAELGKRPKKQLSRQYKIVASDGRELGTLKEWDSGRVVLDIKFNDQKQRDALLNDIKSQFGLDGASLIA
ncbi:ParB/RepB/Spo0J family partition protein [Robbsia sp. KACC 23696]|uniref:ParB/RepB/Spo0J family partition protein n=1 Tax=Robbsia sp. KACC 23696 TaxID=3149231 RepID=UPI00325B3A38